MSGEDCAFELMAQLFWRCVWAGVLVLIHSLLVARREAITRHGRRLQERLRIPRYMHVFSDLEPGILDDDILTASQFLTWACIPALLGLIIALCAGTVWHPIILGLGLVTPGCLLGVLWLVLAYSNRARQRYKVSSEQSVSLLDLESDEMASHRASTEKAACSQDLESGEMASHQASTRKAGCSQDPESGKVAPRQTRAERDGGSQDEDQRMDKSQHEKPQIPTSSLDAELSKIETAADRRVGQASPSRVTLPLYGWPRIASHREVWRKDKDIPTLAARGGETSSDFLDSLVGAHGLFKSDIVAEYIWAQISRPAKLATISPDVTLTFIEFFIAILQGTHLVLWWITLDK